MKYRTNASRDQIESCFGKLFNTDEFDYVGYDEPDETYWDLKRGTQNPEDNVIVNITHLWQLVHLLDYISCDKKTWDYEPMITVNIQGASIQLNRRGNYGHIYSLEKGDSLIIDDYVIKAIKERGERLRDEYNKRIEQ
jgi:hypothetical protein